MLASRGTLVLGMVTKHGAYLAADSRGTNPKTDEAQKLFQFGEHAFAAILGTLSARAEKQSLRKRPLYTGTIDLTEILHHASVGYTDGTDLISYIANHVHTPLKAYWDFLTPSAKAVSDSQDGSVCVCTIPIIQNSGGIVIVSETHFNFAPNGNLTEPTTRVRFDSRTKTTEVAYTWGQCPENTGIDFEPDTPSAALVTISTLFARAKSSFPNTVGGPVDIGLVDSSGCWWISRKGNFE